MNKLSTNSKQKLDTCEKVLQLIVYDVLEDMDIGVTCGHRTAKEQNKQHDEGNSTFRYPFSKHNSLPSHGIDLVVYHPRWKYIWGSAQQKRQIAADCNRSYDTANAWVYMQYARLDTLMQAAAKKHGVKLRWGGKWSHPDDLLHNKLVDLFHWELL